MDVEGFYAPVDCVGGVGRVFGGAGVVGLPKHGAGADSGGCCGAELHGRLVGGLYGVELRT